MKWNVKQLMAGTFRARKTDGLTAYIYRALNWPDFYRHGAPAYEVRYAGRAIALINYDGKGAAVTPLNAAAGFPEITDLDLVELALWVSKLRAFHAN